MNIQQAFDLLAPEYVGYFRKYTFDKPLAMSLPTYHKTGQLGLLLNKAIHYFVANYGRFSHLMPLDERCQELLDMAGKYPFRTGSFRTDFVIDKCNRIKIIEMTTRFPLNGYIQSGYIGINGLDMAKRIGAEGVLYDFPRYMDYLQNEICKQGKVTVIKGHDPMNEFKIYSRIFPAAGIDFNVVDVGDIADNMDKLVGARVIEELTLNEIKSLTNEQIHAMIEAGMYNDVRNIILIHDKRFFKVLRDEAFLKEALSEDERLLLAEFALPSYTQPDDKDQYDAAYDDKDSWILKPYGLGKGEGIVAGCTVDDAAWKELFDSREADRMILQPMVDQRRFDGTISELGEIRSDFVAGTFLYVDNEYYGPGLYRSSSFEVSNQRDFRKVAQLVCDTERLDPQLVTGIL